ncbi:hypothetical protein ACFL4A_03330 [bacterium]
MKKILIINKQKAHLPEIKAYQKYFNDKSDYFFYDSAELKDFNENDFDAVWCFMGVDKQERKIPTVHEYASLSAGKFPKLKNLIKKKINTKPNLRLFLNESVKDGFGFADNVAYIFRDMGVDESFFLVNEKKQYDFVYIGEINFDRKMHKLLRKFANELKQYKLLLIGNCADDIFAEFKDEPNIYFEGKIPYYEIPKLASLAEFGINYIPDIYPYNLQTSTKILEYSAMGLKTISISYKWINEFEKKHEGRFLKVREDLSDFTYERIRDFEYKSADVKSLTWDNIIKNCGLEEALKKIL